jgi:dihydroorotate dehydrogenase electron transfer subunit
MSRTPALREGAEPVGSPNPALREGAEPVGNPNPALREGAEPVGNPNPALREGAERSGVADARYPCTDNPTRTLAPLGRRPTSVVRRSSHGPYVVLTVSDPDGPRPDPGQFYMLTAAERWGGGEDERPFLPRAFSVMRAREGELDFVLEDVGPGTNRLAELGPGDGLLLLGPLGRGFEAPRRGRRPILVGGGVGIAPLAIWGDALGASALTLLGFRDAAHAEGAALIPRARIATDDGSRGYRGLVTALLEAELGCDARAEVYACGPPPMLEAVRRIAVAHGVPAQLAMESGMACGFGACFGCVVPTKRGFVRLCVDGPVVDAHELERVA